MDKEQTIKWTSEVPEKCELCHKPFGKYFIDGVTTLGGWALMCEKCHKATGKGLGIGRGQKYRTENQEGVDGFEE